MSAADCLFCKIVNGTIPSKKAYEDESTYAFHDINPQAPVHILIIPKKHIDGIAQLEQADKELAGHILHVARKLAEEHNLSDGYRVVVNSGESAGQSVFHIHFHLLGGRNLNWPPG